MVLFMSDAFPLFHLDFNQTAKLDPLEAFKTDRQLCIDHAGGAGKRFTSSVGQYTACQCMSASIMKISSPPSVPAAAEVKG